MDWDDLRYVLAVGNAGSLAGAARTLGVNHTTVLRRIGAFEQRLGVRLFERLPTGYVLTAGGEQLIAAARNIDATVTTLERKLAGQDLRLAGTVRVTTTDTVMGSILPEILAEFRHSHPGIQVEIAVSNLMFNLTKREADVAIRPAADPPETLIGRRISGIAFAVYGSPDYLARRGKKQKLADGCTRSCRKPKSRLPPILCWPCARPRRLASASRRCRAISETPHPISSAYISLFLNWRRRCGS
jgi:DNA-binding transcriptional LysR family regulator